MEELFSNLSQEAVRYGANQCLRWASDQDQQEDALRRFASHCGPWTYDTVPPSQLALVSALFAAAIPGLPDGSRRDKVNYLRAAMCRLLGLPQPDFAAEAEAAALVEKHFDDLLAQG